MVFSSLALFTLYAPDFEAPFPFELEKNPPLGYSLNQFGTAGPGMLRPLGREDFQGPG